MTAVIDRGPLDARDALAAVEHDIRGLAATIGTIGRLLSDGRLPKGEEPALFERLTRLAARLETLAGDAQTLSDWLDPAVVRRITWLTVPIAALIESVFGHAGIAVASSDALWRERVVRASQDGALERALRTMRDYIAREGLSAGGWLVIPRDSSCDIVSGTVAPPPGQLRAPFVNPRNASVLAALAVLAVHGVSVWRGRDAAGLGLSIPMERPAGHL